MNRRKFLGLVAAAPLMGAIAAPNVFEELDGYGHRLLSDNKNAPYNDALILRIKTDFSSKMRELQAQKNVLAYNVSTRKLDRNGFIVEVNYEPRPGIRETIHLTYACLDNPTHINFMVTTL